MVHFQQAIPFFTKLMGDGIMCVIELDRNRIKNNANIVLLITQIKKLIESIQAQSWKIRARMVAGDVLRMEVGNRKKKKIDYLGFPINFDFNLLSVRPDINFMAHETVKALLKLKKDGSLRAIPIRIKQERYDGVDKEDLDALWDFELNS